MKIQMKISSNTHTIPSMIYRIYPSHGYTDHTDQWTATPLDDGDDDYITKCKSTRKVNREK